VLGSTWGKVFLADVAVAIFVCCLAIHAMSVRILFAMGRDDNLPGGSRLAHVSGTRRVPVVPAVLVGAIAMLILAFNIYNQYAFEVIIALGIIFMYLAYLGVTIPLLQRRLNGWPGNLSSANDRLFSLGRFAVITNVLAVIYGISMSVNLAWPRDYFYGTKWYQQYGPITGITVVVVSGLALYYGRQQYHGTVLAEHRADVPVAAEGD
jgi:amino acid transporter